MRSFMDIRDSGACYVDKTELIDQILERMAGVFMFLRPRGFGKSVNLSMLDAYLSLGYKGNMWFDGLRISDIRPDDTEKNASPVIYLDLEGLPMDSPEMFRDGLAGRIADACDRFRGLETSEKQDSHDIDILRSLRSKDAGRTMMVFSMSMLSRMLHWEYGRKAIILVDGYDSPILDSCGKPFQAEVMSTIMDLLSISLKGNEHARFGVVTGTLHIVEDSITSGFNNPWVLDLWDVNMGDKFGFAPDEMRGLFAELGHPEMVDEAVGWYGGYHTASCELCSPRGVIGCIADGFRLGVRWSGTWERRFLNPLSDPDMSYWVEGLTSGRGCGIWMGLGIGLRDLADPRGALMDILSHAGILTAVPDGSGYTLLIPNEEMRTIIGDILGGTDSNGDWSRGGA